MTALPASVDAESLIRGWLQQYLGDDTIVCTETAKTLGSTPRTVRVAGAGGSSRFTLAKSRLVIDSFAIAAAQMTPRQATRALALEVDHAMRWLLPRSTVADGITVTEVAVVSSPSWIPDANPDLRHFAATYTPTFSGLGRTS